MQALEGIRKSIDTAEELQSVVKTMKGMAAASIRRFERAVASLDDYSRTVELGLQVLLGGRPERLVAPAGRPSLGAAAGPGDRPEHLGAVVFGSDQGMCGRFNQQIAAHAVEAIRAQPGRLEDSALLIVGARVGTLLEMEGLSVDEQLAPATSLAGITPLVQEILMQVEQWRSTGAADRVVLFYNEALGGAVYRPRTQQLYPVDLEWLAELSRRKWPSRRLPIHSLQWGRLLTSLIREFLYVAIFRASAESLASENAARLASMQSAERNIEERLEDLNRYFRLQRQQAITEELLDIISGFEALSAHGS